MAEPQPQGQKETLAGEYRALRPDSSWDAATVEELRRSVHQQERPLSALCISGGGIRSATFALGALQGLAEQGLLGQVDYLSTVSGGGYIGGWLTAWAHRIGGLARLVPKLRRDAPPPGPGEPDPIQHLREYNNYLSPKLGSFSTDVWTLVATVLRNILLNWMVLVPMMIFAVMVPRFFVWLLSFPELKYGAEIFHGSEPDYAVPVLDAVSGSPWVHYVLPLVSSLLLAVAFFHIVRCLPGIGGRDHSRREYRRFILLPLVGAVFTFLMFDSLYYLGSKFAHYSNLLSVVAWTSLPVLVAWLAYLAVSGLPWRRRLGLLFGAPSFAVLSMATGLGVATWVSTNFLLSSPNPETSPSWAEYVTFGPSVVLLGFCLGTVLFTGLSSSFLADPDREWLSRATAGVLLFSVAWSGLCFLALVAPHWVLAWRGWQSSLLAGVGAVSAWLSSQAGGLAARGADGEGSGKTTKVVAAVATKLAPPLFLAVLAIGLSILVDILLVVAHRATGLPFAGPHGEPIAWWQHYSVLTRSHPALLTLLAATLLALGWFMARYINVNTFSLHGMYRDRLIRAYLGASNPERNASRFTGFAPNDDLPMASVAPDQKPFHVLNLTLNMVASGRLDWQQRKAESFTVSPLACGNAALGYRPSLGYGGEEGISLGTAVAISGAAASPNMGFHTSSVIAFIMTLFNARLGSWLGNPGEAGENTWRQAGPRSALRLLMKEALALTTDQCDYVYLSDGGHFENLGLYEMVRRRCRFIVVLDSAADPQFTFDDLGNALRKIRIDLKIPIHFAGELNRPLRDQKRRCGLATIEYSAVDGPCPNGLLLYIKPMRLGNESPDVASYARANPDFPHQTTADQWFDESQTESYRMLGLLSVDQIASGWAGGSLGDFLRHVETHYLAAPA